MSSFIICLYFLYTFINWHLNYFLYIVYVYDINLLIFCQCSNQPLIYPKIDLPYSGSVVKTKIPLIVKVVVSKNLYSCFDRLSDIVLYLTWVSMNTPFLLTITSGTELLSEHVLSLIHIWWWFRSELDSRRFSDLLQGNRKRQSSSHRGLPGPRVLRWNLWYRNQMCIRDSLGMNGL